MRIGRNLVGAFRAFRTQQARLRDDRNDVEEYLRQFDTDSRKVKYALVHFARLYGYENAQMLLVDCDLFMNQPDVLMSIEELRKEDSADSNPAEEGGLV